MLGQWVDREQSVSVTTLGALALLKLRRERGGWARLNLRARRGMPQHLLGPNRACFWREQQDCGSSKVHHYCAQFGMPSYQTVTVTPQFTGMTGDD